MIKNESPMAMDIRDLVKEVSMDNIMDLSVWFITNPGSFVACTQNITNCDISNDILKAMNDSHEYLVIRCDDEVNEIIQPIFQGIDLYNDVITSIPNNFDRLNQDENMKHIMIYMMYKTALMSFNSIYYSTSYDLADMRPGIYFLNPEDYRDFKDFIEDKCHFVEDIKFLNWQEDESSDYDEELLLRLVDVTKDQWNKDECAIQDCMDTKYIELVQICNDVHLLLVDSNNHVHTHEVIEDVRDFIQITNLLGETLVKCPLAEDVHIIYNEPLVNGIPSVNAIVSILYRKESNVKKSAHRVNYRMLSNSDILKLIDSDLSIIYRNDKFINSCIKFMVLGKKDTDFILLKYLLIYFIDNTPNNGGNKRISTKVKDNTILPFDDYPQYTLSTQSDVLHNKLTFKEFARKVVSQINEVEPKLIKPNDYRLLSFIESYDDNKRCTVVPQYEDPSYGAVVCAIMGLWYTYTGYRFVVRGDFKQISKCCNLYNRLKVHVLPNNIDLSEVKETSVHIYIGECLLKSYYNDPEIERLFACCETVESTDIVEDDNTNAILRVDPLFDKIVQQEDPVEFYLDTPIDECEFLQDGDYKLVVKNSVHEKNKYLENEIGNVLHFKKGVGFTPTK